MSLSYELCDVMLVAIRSLQPKMSKKCTNRLQKPGVCFAHSRFLEVLRAVAVHGQRAGRVVGVVQLIAAPRQLHQLVAQIMVIVGRAVNGFRDALAVGIVAVGDCLAGLAHPRELAAVLPCVSPRAVAQEIADLVRRQALPADAREQIAPTCITVAVVDGALRRAEISSRIGILRLALDVAAVIVGICPRLPRRLIVLAHELVEAVVGIGRRAPAVGDGGDVPARVVGIGIRRRAGFPRPDLPRGRRGRGIVVADRGLDHGLSAALRVHRGHPPQRVIGVASGDGSLRRFRQAVVLIVGIARGVGRAVERLLLRGEVIVVVIAPRDAVCIPAAALLPAHQPILKIVEILRLASARAVCQQAEVAICTIRCLGTCIVPCISLAIFALHLQTLHTVPVHMQGHTPHRLRLILLHWFHLESAKNRTSAYLARCFQVQSK